MFIQKVFRLSFLALLILFSFSCTQKKKEYNEIFGIKYIEAEEYFQNNSWITDTLVSYGVNPNLAISVVFPEVIRYSALKDIAETHSLEVLYTQYGSKYADFSIGQFQMKPSFVYNLEKDWNSFPEKSGYNAYLKSFDTSNNPCNRLERIYRLKDMNWQVKYLVIFCKLIEDRCEKEWVNEKQKVIFLASAYNVGFWYNSEVIKSKGKQNYYYTSLINPKRCFNYSDIALSYFMKKQMPK